MSVDAADDVYLSHRDAPFGLAARVEGVHALDLDVDRGLVVGIHAIRKPDKPARIQP